MNGIRAFGLFEQWGMVSIAFAAGAVFFAIKIINHWRFENYLKKVGYPNIGHGNYFSRFVLKSSERNFFGSTWFAENERWSPLILSIVVFVLGICRAFETEQALELARAGALISIAGLTAIAFGFKEERIIESRWAEIAAQTASPNESAIIKDLGERNRREAASRVMTITFIVSLIGTLLWAYGDQIAACGLFDGVSIYGVVIVEPRDNESGVVCFN